MYIFYLKKIFYSIKRVFLASLYYIHPAGRKYPLLLHFLFPPLSIPHPLIPYFMFTGGFFALVSLLQRVGEFPLPLLTSALSPPPKPGAEEKQVRKIPQLT